MTKRVLVIAYVFPPIAYAGTHRTLRLCKYLSRLGYELHVLSIKVQKDLHNDFDLLDKIKNVVTIHRTHTIDVWRFYNKYKRRFLKTKTGKLLDRIISFLIEMLSQPDHMNLWVPFAVTTAKKIIKRHSIEIVYTTSPPHSQLITGLVLKKMTNIVWIADLRDPILFNIGSANWNRIDTAANRLLEKLTMSGTDAVVTNTKAAKDELECKYNQSQVYCVHNSFDIDDFDDLGNQKYAKFTIAHMGTVYGFRNSEAFFDAISELNQKGEISPEGFEVRFYGICDNILRATIEQYNLWNYVKILPLVPHRQALEVMVKSHMLLLLKGFSSSGLGQIPGKLFEYVGSGNPILYVGPEICEAAEIIKETAKSYVAGNNKNMIKNAINAEYQEYRKVRENQYVKSMNKYPIERYSSLNMARRISTLFDSVNSKKLRN